MGRDWFYNTVGGGGKPPFAASDATKHMNRKAKDDKISSSVGCMSAIYSLFDIQHHHQLRIHHPSFVAESPLSDSQHFRGIEAPRNSLESPESAIADVPSSSLPKLHEPTNLNMPVGGIQIKTNRSEFTDDLSSECCNSLGTKTPNLVARLMGLDLLPEHSSPRTSSSSVPENALHRSRTLPATTRLTTASRRSTDNDHHHNLSVQIDKENCHCCIDHEHDSLHWKTARRINKSSSEISEFAKQVNSRRRRAGADITNAMLPTSANLVLLKPKKSLALLQTAPEKITKENQENLTRLSRSRKRRPLDVKSSLSKVNANSHLQLIKEVKSKCQTTRLHKRVLMKQENVGKDERMKRISSELRLDRVKNMSQQAHIFVAKKKSTTLPNHGLNVKNEKKFPSFKIVSSSPRIFSQKQVSLPSNLNSPYNSNSTRNVKTATASSAANGSSFSDLFDNEMLKRDTGRPMRRLFSTAFETEMEEIVAEIEGEITERLLHEIAPETVAPARSDRVMYNYCSRDQTNRLRQ